MPPSLRRYRSKRPRLLVTACVLLAGAAFGHGDLHERIASVTAAIAKSPSDGNLYLQRAGLHAEHQDLPSAAADYDRAESLQADPVGVWLGRGKLAQAAGQNAEACATLDRLLAREPRHVDALITRARARGALGDVDGAAADFSAGIAASARPEPEYFLERAAILAEAKPPRWDEAIRGLDEGLKQLGDGIVTLQLAAIDLEVAAGRLEAALCRIERAASKAQRPESWLIRQGDVLARAGRAEEARQAYGAALSATARLPGRVRALRSTADLEAQARAALARLPGSQPVGKADR